MTIFTLTIALVVFTLGVTAHQRLDKLKGHDQ